MNLHAINILRKYRDLGESGELKAWQELWDRAERAEIDLARAETEITRLSAMADAMERPHSERALVAQIKCLQVANADHLDRAQRAEADLAATREVIARIRYVVDRVAPRREGIASTDCNPFDGPSDIGPDAKKAPQARGPRG